jgi:hypothetical protein
MLLLCAALAGCSPTFDWREVRPEGSGAMLMLPCKPSSQSRRVRLAGEVVELTLVSCRTGGVTWALAFADVLDPARVGPALRALGQAAADNLGAAPGEPLPVQVQGATPHPDSMRRVLSGQLPDGQPVQEQVAVFSKGTRVFQASCVGAQLPPAAAETFFGGLQTPG